jgi:hypothetical protein
MIITGRQMGGGTEPGRDYVVGEHEPEILRMGSRPGHISTMDQYRDELVGALSGSLERESGDSVQVGTMIINPTVQGTGLNAQEIVDQITKDSGRQIVAQTIGYMRSVRRSMARASNRNRPGAI